MFSLTTIRYLQPILIPRPKQKLQITELEQKLKIITTPENKVTSHQETNQDEQSLPMINQFFKKITAIFQQFSYLCSK